MDVYACIEFVGVWKQTCLLGVYHLAGMLGSFQPEPGTKWRRKWKVDNIQFWHGNILQNVARLFTEYIYCNYVYNWFNKTFDRWLMRGWYWLNGQTNFNWAFEILWAGQIILWTSLNHPSQQVIHIEPCIATKSPTWSIFKYGYIDDYSKLQNDPSKLKLNGW